MGRPKVRCGLDPSCPYQWFYSHFGDRNCQTCRQCIRYDACSQKNMRGQLNCPFHREECGNIHWTNIHWLQPDGRWLIAPEMICKRGDHAIEFILSLLRGRAKGQPRGFTISSRKMRRALGKHFNRNTNGILKIDAFVTDALLARGIMQSIDKTGRREVFRVNADSVRDLLLETVTATCL